MISVITRTKDRKLFLPRLYESLLQQSYRPIEWIIVNDAGEEFEELLNTFQKKVDKDFHIKYLYKKNSTTMEAATNFALQHAQGTFINILDDDDTIESNFYEEAIHHLEKENYNSLQGVISYAQYIYEEVDANETITFIKQEPFPTRPTSILLTEMLTANQFPIHSFVYYKKALKKVGYYNESLPVLGDWEFNIRFLEQYDISIIPKNLVNYHRRTTQKYGNTITTKLSDHHKYSAFIRNNILRKYKENPAMAIFMNESTNSSIMMQTLRQVTKTKDEVIAGKNAQIQERDSVISTKNTQIQERDLAIANKNAQIQERDIVIATKNSQIQEKESFISTLNAQLEEKESLISTLNTQLEEKESLISTLNTQLEVTKAEKSSLEKSIQDLQNLKNRELQAFKDQLRVTQREIARLNELAQSLRLKNRLKRTLFFGKYAFIKQKLLHLKKDNFKTLFHKIQNRLQTQFQNGDVATLKMQDVQNIVNQNYIGKPKEQPLVSILILTRDGIVHIKRLFKTLKENTLYKNFEIIVVDNASSDETIKFLEENPYKFNLRIIKNKKNESFSYANNQAARIAKGDYFLLLNNDIAPLKGWLTHLVEAMQTATNVGSIGSQLIYPYDENEPFSLKVQHSGIAFRFDYIEELKLQFFRPYNLGMGKAPILQNRNLVVGKRLAVTAACLLVKKDVYFEVDGLDEEYNYGYEDVDFGLKLHKKGYTNYYCQNSILFHYESSTQKLESQKSIKGRRIDNINLLHSKWHHYIKEHFFFEKFKNNARLFSEKKLTIAFAVTEAGESAVAGDYFTALELAEAFKEMGYNISFLRRKGGDWYNVPSDVDVLVSMLDAYDLTQIKNKSKNLITLAWVRNWPDRWLENPSFNSYNLIFASSQTLCDMLHEKTGKDVTLFPIATTPEKFIKENNQDISFKSDYSFTGNYWGVPREIETFLEPKEIKFQFSIYGKDWNLVEKFKNYHKGFLNYADIPKVYANSKITIDDAVVGITKPYGSVNSRVFDAIAGGTLVVTNGVVGAEETFGDLLPTYETKEELHAFLNEYLEDDAKREAKIKKLQEFIYNHHTYRIRAQLMKQKLEEFTSIQKSIVIKMPIPSWEEAKNWGDYHLALGLQKQFNKLGYYTLLQVLPEWDNKEGDACDIVLVLRGLSKYTIKKHQVNLMWNISHPDKISNEEYNSYDIVFVSSDTWATKLQAELSTQVKVMHQCTDTDIFKPYSDDNYKTELLFLGNSRKIFRKALKYLLPTQHKLSVFGTLWEGLIDAKYIKGQHIENKDVYKYYSNADIVLNDHWDSMRENGFISNRLFDVLACNGFILTDDVKGIYELFGDTIITYNSKEDLQEKVDYYLENEQERKTLSKKGRELVLQKHTYENRVKQILLELEK